MSTLCPPWPNHALQRTAAGRRGCNRRLVAAVAELGSLDVTFPRAQASRRRGLLASLLFILLIIPWILWTVAAYTKADWTAPLIVRALFWIAIPASLFGQHLFRPLEIGYDPVGMAGWTVAALFYVAIAIGIWLILRGILSARKKRRI